MEIVEVIHWIIIALCIVVCITGVVGNGLVVYFVVRKDETGAFRHINKVVRNLAITDFLLGLIGAPLLTVRWTWGKTLFKLK